MTLISVVLGLWRMAPGLGVALFVVSLPAALRTVTSVRRRKQRTGERTSAAEKIAKFVVYLAIMIGIGSAAIAAFFAAMLVACSRQPLFQPPPPWSPIDLVPPALIATGFVVPVILLWLVWRKKLD